MPDSNVPITAGLGTNIDTRTNAGGDHRQVVVLGDQTGNDAVADVRGADPASNAEGLVVRDPWTTNIVSGLRDVRVQSIVDGTLSIGSIGGSMAVYFQGSNPAVTSYGMYGATKAPLLVNTDGAIKVYDIVNGTIGAVTNITNSIAVHLLSTGGTVNVQLKPGTIAVSLDPGYTLGSLQGIANTVAVFFQGSSPAVSAEAKYGATKVPLLGNTDGALKIYDIVTGTINAVTNITNSIAVHLLSTGGTVNVQLKPGTIAVSLDPGYTLGYIAGTKATLAVSLDPGYTLGKVDQGNATTSGVQAWLTNSQHTANIFTVSGSTSGVSVSGVTLISPSANASFKVFAFSLQTTGIVSQVMYFGNGAGAGQTEFWRPLITAAATTSAPIGANLAVTPPGFLFATGASTTLVLVKDTASLVHYSVSYIKESA